MTTYTLHQLHTFIRRFVALNLPEAVWVEAELAEVDQRRGHFYLSLVEKDKESDQLHAQGRAVLWQMDARRWQKVNKIVLEQLLQTGRKVKLQVKVSFHQRYGMTLQVVDLDPNYTLGVLAQQRALTLETLQLEGALEQNKQLLLPIVPQRLAVISSPKAAGWEDFNQQLRDNSQGYAFRIDFYPAAMQGPQASPEICRQLRTINRRREYYDALIIIRGGGARTDLTDFDELALCRAAAQTDLPIITGIGHETDQSILDLVAHTALKTPTAVAGFLVERLLYFEQQLIRATADIQRLQQNYLQQAQFHLTQMQQQWTATSRQQVALEQQRLRLSAEQLPTLLRYRLERAKSQLTQLSKVHQLLDVDQQLIRGFAILSHDNKIIHSIASLNEKPEVTVYLKDGKQTLKNPNFNE